MQKNRKTVKRKNVGDKQKRWEEFPDAFYL